MSDLLLNLFQPTNPALQYPVPKIQLDYIRKLVKMLNSTVVVFQNASSTVLAWLSV